MAMRSMLLPVDQENGGRRLLDSERARSRRNPPLLHPLSIDHHGPATVSSVSSGALWSMKLL